MMRGGSREEIPLALQLKWFHLNCSKAKPAGNLTLLLFSGMGASAGAYNLYFKFKSGVF